jgi:hypothetical protein
MKKLRRETITVEHLLHFLDEEFDDSIHEAELIKQLLEQLLEGNSVEPGDEFYAPGYVLVIEGEPTNE